MVDDLIDGSHDNGILDLVDAMLVYHWMDFDYDLLLKKDFVILANQMIN